MSAPASQGSFWSSFRAYLAERFPVPVIAMLGLGTGLGAYAAAQQPTIAAGAPLLIDGTALGGSLMVFLFLFHLRVFDEHKDFQIDAETRPDRPVQRGLISLNQLTWAGAVAIALELALGFVPGVTSGLLWLIPLGYSVLMLFEFFAAEWLSARIFLYAFTHTLVMALIALVLGARFSLELAGEIVISPALWGFTALAFTTTVGIDVLRKTWAAETEIDGLDSYSKRFGIPTAGLMGVMVLLASAVAAGVTGWLLGGRAGWLAVVVAVTAWGIWEIRGFVNDPEPGREKRLEMVAGVHLLTLYFGVVVVAALQHGLAVDLAGGSFTLGA